MWFSDRLFDKGYVVVTDGEVVEEGGACSWEGGWETTQAHDVWFVSSDDDVEATALT